MEWKNMYLWYMPPATIKAEWCKEPHLKAIAEANGGEGECHGLIEKGLALEAPEGMCNTKTE